MDNKTIEDNLKTANDEAVRVSKGGTYNDLQVALLNMIAMGIYAIYYQLKELNEKEK